MDQLAHAQTSPTSTREKLENDDDDNKFKVEKDRQHVSSPSVGGILRVWDPVGARGRWGPGFGVDNQHAIRDSLKRSSVAFPANRSLEGGNNDHYQYQRFLFSGTNKFIYVQVYFVNYKIDLSRD